jgi:hypothetical protein
MRDEMAAPVVASAQTVVASIAPSVVASVVASREKPRATTDATTGASVVAASNATTERRAMTWRIEINRRPKAGGGYSFHWLYRFGSGDERRAVYGGTVDALIALNPARWQKYLEVTNGKKGRSTR